MFSIIRSDLARLFKLRSLRIFMVITVVCDVLFTAFNYWYDHTLGEVNDIFVNNRLVTPGLLIECAVVLGNFIGYDHTDRTMVNKIISGHSRTEIFLATWITGFICMAILTVWTHIVTLTAGFCFGSAYLADTGQTVRLIMLTFLMMLVCTSFYTALYMSVPIQSLSMILGIFAAVFVFAANTLAVLGFEEEKYIDAETAQVLEENGQPVDPVPGETEKYYNPYYSEKGRTPACITDVLSPVSHILYRHDSRLIENICAMLSESVLFTAGGIIIFRKRSIR